MSEEGVDLVAGSGDPELAKKLSESSDEDLKKEDANDDAPLEDEFDREKFPVREWEFIPFGFSEPVAFNPVVSIFGVVVLWGLALWSMLDPEGSNNLLVDWRGQVSYYFTWLFVGTRAAFFLFLVYVAVKYGHIKLGPNDEPPEFDSGSYFSMIFAAGVAVGLFVFGVSEPLWHQDSHFYANAGYRSQDEIDMFAINMTVTNWGISGWAPYLVVAVAVGLAGHRFNLPMTFRSCFFPILGAYTWGWIGDLIDGSAIVVTVAGVCTSLGLGAIQIVAGFQRLGWVASDLSEDSLTAIQNATIWAITAVATASVISGLNAGVKFLSLLAFLLGMFLLMLVFVMDDTKYLMNLIVQETGYFLQHSVVLLNFWTDAFGQLEEGAGRASDGNAAATWWMAEWGIFYQAWWVSWSCFVGLFVARISRGRTVAEVIIYSMVAPISYCILWFCVWGGIGLRQARQAMELEQLGSTYFNDSTTYLQAGSTVCYNVPQEDVVFNDTVIFTNRMLGVTPVCQFDSGNSEQAAYNVLYSFSFPADFETGFGPTLTVIFIVGLAIYFATSSDSGSLVVDHLASNGRKHHHWVQRLFWAVTEGAVATALLAAGGAQALQAVQAASIVSGLPFVFYLVYIMQTIQVLCEFAVKNPDSYEYVQSTQPEFTTPVYGGVFNIVEYMLSLGNVDKRRVELGMDKPTGFQTFEFLKGVFVPFLPLWDILAAVYPRNTVTNAVTVTTYGVFYYSWVALFCAYGKYTGLIGWAWTMFFSAACLLASVRNGFRGKYNLRSNAVGDGIASLFFWPQVLAQMREACVEMELPKSDD